MSNAMNEHKIMERLGSEHDMELMQLEISKMLDEELSKPAEEMDMQLIDELMDLLGVEGMTDIQEAQCRSEIHRKLRARKSHSWMRAFTRVAAGFIVLVMLFFVSFETAKAFRWTHLLKILAPVAETFGIYSTSSIDSDPPAQSNLAYTDEETDYSQQVFNTLAEMPAEKDGFRVIPQWLPERFGFLQGTLYEDPDMAEATVSYQAGDDFLLIRLMISYNDESAFVYSYERTLDEPLAEEINGIAVSFYENMDDRMMSASWINREAHYHLTGNLTLDEARQIAASMVG